jgi:phage-related protein
MTWSIEAHDEHLLERLYAEASNLDNMRALDDDLAQLRERGLGLLQTNRLKSLGNGLYELRIRRSPDLLMRVFLTMIHPRRLILLSAYNKQRDPSEIRQRREIKKARNLIEEIQGRK